jgi:hypothetical protein
MKTGPRLARAVEKGRLGLLAMLTGARPSQEIFCYLFAFEVGLPV